MRVTMKELDEWLFRGLGGVVNMMVTRCGYDIGYPKSCKMMVDNEAKRLLEIRERVAANVGAGSEEPTVFTVDTWFVRGYTGIGNWLSERAAEGPTIDPAVLDDLQAHIDKIQEIVDDHRRRNQDGV